MMSSSFHFRDAKMGFSRTSGLILACMILLAGCAESRQLMPTPNLYTDKDATLFSDLPPEFTSTQDGVRVPLGMHLARPLGAMRSSVLARG